ncbi:MAG: arylesterase [Bacteroidetes bacterium]|nr:arylesterase [Bacteroidota bacterium]
MRVFLLLLLFLTPPPGKEKHILFLGDSLTAGLGLSADQAFPALIEKELNKDHLRVKVTNAGLSGETSAGGLSRVGWMLRTPVDVLVLELGANDGLRGLPAAQTKNNLQAIIDKVRSKYPQVKIILTGMMVPPNMGPAYSAEFKKIYPDLAEKNKTLLMPFLLEGIAGHEKLNQPDGIHPTAEGHRIIAQNLIKYLLKVL